MTRLQSLEAFISFASAYEKGTSIAKHNRYIEITTSDENMPHYQWMADKLRLTSEVISIRNVIRIFYS